MATFVVNQGRDVKKRISQSELDVMDVLWTESPLGASEVATHLAESKDWNCLLYTSPSPRDATLSRMPSSA